MIDFDLNRPFLTLADFVLDDDQSGDSHGNGDGRADYGETIELSVWLENVGELDALDVTAQLLAESPYVELLVDEAEFGTIPAGGTATSTAPLLLSIASEVPDDEPLPFTLLVSEDPGARPLDLVAHAPVYLAGLIALDDATGDGDGLADPGERVALQLRIQNVGGSTTPDLTAALGSHSPYFSPEAGTAPVGILPVGGGAEVGELWVELEPGCPPFHSDYLSLELGDGADYQMEFPLVFCAGHPFGDDLERDAVSWTHAAGETDWLDQWHREGYRNHTPGGAVSWKCGGPGDAPYENLVYAILETADFVVPPHARLEFWHWIDAQDADSLPGWALDGGLLEISTDAGETWTQLTPEGGYPYQIRPSTPAGPFPLFTPVWSGEHDWTEVTVDLSDFTGTARLRWAFGSNGTGTAEGWYIDDPRIGGGWPSEAPGARAALGRVFLAPAVPNPLAPAGGGRAAVEVRWHLPAASTGQLGLYDPSGRRLGLLARGPWRAGVHRLLWDGQDDRGRPLPSGTYYLRLEAGGLVRSDRLVLVR
ncbi:MAG: hypothetical protein GF330_11405 [Candidatus Eisenbacteria bacterium]|nr:hypothetical protein [Candidatus Eisenbacteria bacterium]